KVFGEERARLDQYVDLRDADDLPAAVLEPGSALAVVGGGFGSGVVLFAVVLDADLAGGVAQVDAQRRAVGALFRDLGGRAGETGVDQERSGPALAGRLCASIAGLQDLAQPFHVGLSCEAVSTVRERQWVNALAQEPVESGDGLQPGQPAGTVEGGAL